MSTLTDNIERLKNYNLEQERDARVNTLLENYTPSQKMAWKDWAGNVNISNLTTGNTNRYYQAFGGDVKSPSEDSFGADLGQAARSGMMSQGAGIKSLLTTAGLAIGGLAHRDNNWQPEVGSALWRLQEGAEASQGVVSRLQEDAEYGRSGLSRFAMRTTSAAVPFAAQRAMDMLLPGAGSAMMYASAAGSGGENARQRGLSISTQVLKSALRGTAAWATEHISKVGGLKGRGGEGLIDGWYESIMQNIANKGGDVLLPELAWRFASEGAEEILEDYFNYWGDKFLAGVTKGDYDVEELPSAIEIAYDGLIGGLLGLFGGAPEAIVAQSRQNSMRSQYGDQGNKEYAAYREAKRNTEKLKNIIESADSKPKFSQLINTANEYTQKLFDGARNWNEARKARKGTASQEAPQTATEAQEAPAQQITPEQAEVRENAPSRELNSQPEARAQEAITPEEMTALDERIDRGEIAEPNPEVFLEQPDLQEIEEQEALAEEPESDRIEEQEKKTGSEILAEQATKKEHTKAQKINDEERIAKSKERALAQNGIDFSYDPRADLEIDEDTGDYKAYEPYELGEEEWEQYREDIKQARLLDAVDNWLNKYSEDYLNAQYGTPESRHASLEKGLNNFVYRWLNGRESRVADENVDDELGELNRERREREANEREDSETPEWADVHVPTSRDGRGARNNARQNDWASFQRGRIGTDSSRSALGPEAEFIERTQGLPPAKVGGRFAASAAVHFGPEAVAVQMSGWPNTIVEFVKALGTNESAWFALDNKHHAAAFYSPTSDGIGFSTSAEQSTNKSKTLTCAGHEFGHRCFIISGADAHSFNDSVFERAGIDPKWADELRLLVGQAYLIKSGFPSAIDTSLSVWRDIITEMLSEDASFAYEVDQELATRLLSGEYAYVLGARNSVWNAKQIQSIQDAAREIAHERGIADRDILRLFPTANEYEAELADNPEELGLTKYNRWSEIEDFVSKAKQAEEKTTPPAKAKQSNPQAEYEQMRAEEEGGKRRDLKQEAKEKSDREYEAKRKADKEEVHTVEDFAREENSEEAEARRAEERLKDVQEYYGEEYDGVKKAAEDFAKIKTFVDAEDFGETTRYRNKQNEWVEEKFYKGNEKLAAKTMEKLRSLMAGQADGSVEADELFRFYESLKSNPALANFYNTDVQRQIDKFRKFRDTLDERGYNWRASHHAAADAIRMMTHKFAQAAEYQATLDKINDTVKNSKNGLMKKLGKSKGVTSAVARAMVRWQINPDTVFKMLDAFDKGNFGEGYRIAKQLQESQHTKYSLLQAARSILMEVNENKDYADFAFGKQTVKDNNGRTWDARTALTLVKTMETIKATPQKSLNGTYGIGVQMADGNVEYIDLSSQEAYEMYKALKAELGETAKQYGDAAGKVFSEVFKDPVHDKRLENDGVELQMVEGDKYSPLAYIDKDGNITEFDVDNYVNHGDIPGFAQERASSGRAYLYIRPYTDVVDSYARRAADYVAYSSFNQMMKAFGTSSTFTPSLSSTLAEAYGSEMGNWFRNYVEDLNENGSSNNTNALLTQARHRLQQGALLFSVSVPMKQISSYWAASGILHPDSLIKNYRVKLAKPKNGSDAAAMLASRAMGNVEQSASEAAKDTEKWLGKLKYSSKLVRTAANAINQMDYNTVSNLLSACEYEVLKYQFDNDQSKIGTEEYKQAVEELFQDVVDRSQPNFDKQFRAEYGRTDNELIRMMSMFRTQQTQNLNLLATAIGEYQAAKGTKGEAKATETLRNTIAGQAASVMSLSVLTILSDMLLHKLKKYRDDDEEDDSISAAKIAGRLGINAIEYASSTMWFGDQIAKWAIDQLSGGETNEFYGVNLGVVTTLSNVVDSLGSVIQSPTRSNVKYAAGQIATLLGIPLNNAYAIVNSAVMYAKDISGGNDGDYDDILRYLDAQTKQKAKATEAFTTYQAKREEAGESESTLTADTYSQIKQTVKEAKADTAEWDSGKDNAIMQQILDARLTDEQTDEVVNTYMGKSYRTFYDALRDYGLSPSEAADTGADIDEDGNGSLKQAELYQYYREHPEQEKIVIAIWSAYGWKTEWSSYKAKQK